MVIFFFFSSRRRHTRYWRDWSSDVCSSDLSYPGQRDARHGRLHRAALLHAGADSFSQGSAPFRKGTVSRRAVGDAPPRSEERRVGKSVDLGGRRIIKKKTHIA